MLLHSLHSGCHGDSILGSHLAGVLSMTCREGEGGNDEGRSEKYTRAFSKVNYTYSPLPAPALDVMPQPAFPQRLKAGAEIHRMRLRSPAPYSHMVYMVYEWNLPICRDLSVHVSSGQKVIGLSGKVAGGVRAT